MPDYVATNEGHTGDSENENENENDNDNDNDNEPSGSASASRSGTSSSSSTSLRGETLAERDRRYTAAEKGKGRAPAPVREGDDEAIVISDNEDDYSSRRDGEVEGEEVQVTGIKRKVHLLDDDDDDDDEMFIGDGPDRDRQQPSTDDGDEIVEVAVEEEDTSERLGEFSESPFLKAWCKELGLIGSLSRMFLRTNTGRHDLLVCPFFPFSIYFHYPLPPSYYILFCVTENEDG